jgi:hypothetical protein
MSQQNGCHQHSMLELMTNVASTAAERRFPNVFEQPFGHLVLLIHMGKRLEHGVMAIGATIPLPLHMDTNAFAVHREIEEELLAFAGALQEAKTPA